MVSCASFMYKYSPFQMHEKGAFSHRFPTRVNVDEAMRYCRTRLPVK